MKCRLTAVAGGGVDASSQVQIVKLVEQVDGVGVGTGVGLEVGVESLVGAGAGVGLGVGVGEVGVGEGVGVEFVELAVLLA